MAAPLDYTNTSDDRRASIALVKYPAGGGNTPRSDVLGSIFFNPGGPGGSGIGFLTAKSPSRGGLTAAYFDKIFEGRYDLLSFDPRAVGRTTPKANCFLDDDEGAYANEIFFEGSGLPHSSDHAIVKSIAHDNLISGVCKKNKGEELTHVSTASVVNDMSLMRKAVGDKHLNYAGFSYGTVLGSYFADILPEEVGKFWLDGVVNVPNYQQGLWDDGVVDFEDVLSGFFTTCADAGVEHCPLATLLNDDEKQRGDKGAEILRDQTFDLLESLRDQPIAVLNASLPQMSTYIGLKAAIFSTMYAPSKWANFTKLLVEAHKGNHVPLVEASGITRLPHKPATDGANDQAQFSIMCGEALQYDEDWDEGDYKKFLDKLEKISPFGGELWVRDGAICQSAWKIRAKDTWRGSFNSTPANPILFGSNDYDPVTPLRAARKMRDSFRSDNKLFRIEKGYGHCTIAAPSRCGSKTVGDWFVRGVLPEEKEKVCQLDVPPYFPQPTADEETMSTLSMEERRQVEAAEAMQTVGEIMAEWRQRNGRRFKF